MHNIVRHSEATKVWVTFKIKQDHLILTLRGNGKGFELKKEFSHLKRTFHFGLVGMKERAELMGGELSIFYEPVKGTT